jgi:catechol 2,3-dioxygenase-like lactoylglutathione lyase family enzyme
MKSHINLATTSVEKSVEFYAVLLATAPAKVLPDCALFVTDEPALELALDLTSAVEPLRGVHFGVCVDGTADVEDAIERLDAAGLVSSVERDETCCYANQTKVWAIDHDGRRWEIYTVIEDTAERNNEETTCCSTEGEERSCCAA